jgi:hypothetical protein
VSVSNSVMMVTFIAMEWHERRVVPDAARAGAQDRLRPILMTACAMTVGMVPMALALERGSEMEAPLGRAVIGGLVASTFVTLFIVPSVFALLMGGQTPRSPSLHPDDPASAHYDPMGAWRDALTRTKMQRTTMIGSGTNQTWAGFFHSILSPCRLVPCHPVAICGCSDPKPLRRRRSASTAVKPVHPPRTVAAPSSSRGDRAYDLAYLYARPVSSRSGMWTSGTG